MTGMVSIDKQVDKKIEISITTEHSPLLITRALGSLFKSFFLLFFFCYFSHLTLASTAKDLTTNAEVLTLERAIKKALASNWDIRKIRNNLRNSKIAYDNAFDVMYMPKLNLGASLNSYQTQATLNGSTASDRNNTVSPLITSTQGIPAGSYSQSHGYPSSTIALGIAQYNIFNFFKDQLAYDKARLTWEREQQRLIENERALRFSVISSYFANKTEQDKLEAAKRSVEIAEAIYELVKSNFELGRAKNTDLNSSTVDFLNAKSQLALSNSSVNAQRWALNFLMGDSVEAVYSLKTDFEYTPLQIDLQDAIKLFADNAPVARDATLTVKSAEIDLELAEKNRLPLPTVSLSGLSVQYGNSYWGNTATYGTSPSDYSGNIDIVTSLNFTIPLYGPGGFLAKRTIESATILRDNSDINFQQVMMKGKVDIQTSMISLKQIETTVALTKESMTNASKLLEVLFGNFSKNGANRLELRDAITQARTIEFSYRDAVLQHLVGKLFLAQTIGVDHLPGEFF